MKKTKLYFRLEIPFNDDVEIIANNHIDLENYLESELGIKVISIIGDEMKSECLVKIPNDLSTYYAELKWVTQI